MNWIENLPENCPPENSFIPNEFKVFRLAVNKTYNENDFQSQRAQKPTSRFKGINECIARSLSVFNNVDKCKNMSKLPLYKGRWKSIIEIDLNEKDGLVLKTFKDNHYSWWISTTFDNSKIKVINIE